MNFDADGTKTLDIQEFMIRPDKAKSFTEAMRKSFLVKF